MFDNEKFKQSEKVDDIFADTDTVSEPKKEISDSISPPKETPPVEPELKSEREPEAKIETEDDQPSDNKYNRGPVDRAWFKPVAIALLIIVVAVGIYFLFNIFSTDDQEDLLLSPPDLSDQDDNFSPSPPELIDPSLVIPEPIIEEPEVVEEIEELEEELEEEIEEEEKITISLLAVSFVDSDGDGLSDLTEELLSLDPNNPDTDGDGYSDYEEIISGYNPAGPGRLPDNFPAIRHQSNGLSFFYPRTWQIADFSDSWVVIAPDKATIEISREETDYSNVFNWYQDQFDDFSWITEDRQIINKDMERAIISSDGSTVFLVSEASNYLFTINLEPSDNNDFIHFSELALIINTLIQQ